MTISSRSKKSSSKPATCEWLDGNPGTKLVIQRFDKHQASVLADSIPGCRFHKGTDSFRAPGDIQTLRMIKRRLGKGVVFSRGVVEWVNQLREIEGRMGEIQRMTDAELPVFREYRPEIYERMRPDQRVGTLFLKESPGSLIADDPGLGKTWQVIASIVEAGTLNGPNLVICPKISIENVWLEELNLLQDEAVFIAPEGRRAREAMFEELAEANEMEVPFWLVINWSMVTLRNGAFQFPELQTIPWNNVIVDEAHLTGMSNHQSLTAQGLVQLPGGKRIAMTGTPMGGKPLRLWGILHWLDQQQFNNQYQWAERWVEKSTGYGMEGRTFDVWRGVQRGKEEEFARAHSKYIIRRTKGEVFKEMPPPHIMEVWVEMLPKQQKQYKEMEEKARITIEEAEEVLGRVNITTMLATYAWLKQFANGYCDLAEKGWQETVSGPVMKYKAVPIDEASPKLDAVWSIIQELSVDEGSGEKVLIFSQFKGWAELTARWLQSKGVEASLITGDVKSSDRTTAIADFQDPNGRAQVMVMTTQAAGTSINLDMADNVIFMDETWNPDDQEQALNRAHRASRIHLVTVRYLRTKDTIEYDVRKKNNQKRDINEILLDRYRLSQGGEG
jgi:SNF2 family DNA or RNA helicase